MTIRRRIAGLLALLLCAALSLSAAADATLTSTKTTLRGASRPKKTNIALAIDAINGTELAVGDFFSFNDTVGPRTSSYGYVNAINGRGVKVTGGGVGQVASTLYLALQNLSGITYDEKETYANFTDNYVSSKKNAILVDYKAGVDFSFYNDSESDFRIDLWMSGDSVHCALVSSAAEAGITTTGPGAFSFYLDGTTAMIDNITLAADSVSDTTLESGDIFSFNDIVGPRTQRYGYQMSGSERALDGGVALLASALYLSVKDLDTVEITEKTAYKDDSRGYGIGQDPVAVDYQADMDFCFQYTGYGTLSIYTYVSGDTLYTEVVEN